MTDAQSILAWYTLVPAEPSSGSAIFGFSEYLAALALLLVIFSISEFRYRYRLHLQTINWKFLSLSISASLGVLLLFVQFWFENRLPIPSLLNDPSIIKGVIGLIIIALLFVVAIKAYVLPPMYGRFNAQRFFDVHYHYLHQADPDQLRVIADELSHSILSVARFARLLAPTIREKGKGRIPARIAFAHDFFLLISDRRFCKVIGDRVPYLAVIVLRLCQKPEFELIPVGKFARQAAISFISNPDSAYYEEAEPLDGSYFGYEKPITTAIFGSYRFVERCGSESSLTPLSIGFSYSRTFDRVCMNGYSRAALHYLKDYLVETGGTARAQGVYDVFATFSAFSSSIYRLNGAPSEQLYESRDYHSLVETVEFIKGTLIMLKEGNHRIGSLKYVDRSEFNIYDQLSSLVHKLILSSGSVAQPSWTSWVVQHNELWAELFSFDDSYPFKILRKKVHRLIYNDVIQMDRYANFKGARTIGYCLNVLGLTPIKRNGNDRKESFPIQSIVLSWTRKNYGRLLKDNPKVAAAMMQGSISYDPESRQIIKTYRDDIGNSPSREFLAIG
ncbi:hypothetical protein NKH49_05145 [Mesorhizobium sp. M1088]|uniref:hypothetical protein n=1 Tax=Mesorhizobium sp. M1088 TaxID=2957056 RepID=UPI00333BA3C6